MRYLPAVVCLAGLATAFPFIAKQPGIQNTHLLLRQQSGSGPGSAATCPFNPNHQDAIPVSDEYPYNSAINGSAGKGIGGYLVPAPGDPDHQFIAPTDQDIRGPCPGLNAAANYGFLSRDGITTYSELTDAVQNVYNMGYDLAQFLALISIIVADGDIITKKVSIGCDATTRTASPLSISGSEPGLDGHNKFEGDVSLTRDDFFLANGDDFDFNGTLFGMMAEVTGGTFDLEGLGTYRYQRYVQSREENPEMFFGPLGLFQYGAAAFVYELMPSGADNYVPTLENTASFFGAEQQPNGTWTHVPERIPANWTNRISPFTLLDVVGQISAMYGAHPVGIGGNVDGAFVGLDFPPYIEGGNLTAATPADYACFLYQLISGPIPSSLNSVITPLVEALEFVLVEVGGETFTNLGCPVPLTR
ncbi:Cloroperoxidase [Mollisia scopiformis]|uniref:Cloroperoxidase n=1 Tax=Mollisia scopiformis TaxID=149040 RepID=A0A194WXZ5_MOLSC|nr:Cloroperoxidase [Mollisia scopiformis]KUJ12795.1 Cloroperoxidase [Mollisia scopiformis]